MSQMRLLSRVATVTTAAAAGATVASGGSSTVASEPFRRPGAAYAHDQMRISVSSPPPSEAYFPVSRSTPSEDWDFCDSVRSDTSSPLGPRPSVEEADFAANAIFDSLMESYPKGGHSSSSSSSSSSLCHLEPSASMAESEEVMMRKMSITTSSHEDGLTEFGSSSYLRDALSVLRSNQMAQGVVRSLARDSAVWDAINANQDMQDFMNAARSQYVSLLEERNRVYPSTSEPDTIPSPRPSKPTSENSNNPLGGVQQQQQNRPAFLPDQWEASGFMDFVENLFKKVASFPETIAQFFFGSPEAAARAQPACGPQASGGDGAAGVRDDGAFPGAFQLMGSVFIGVLLVFVVVLMNRH
eukprot:TRINITY_DN211_c0_g1_i1.p1 TRINITY_DN211_c0_g1~~TRINITY_DN211_c0_g1_i1.p1  ORF type:complete len:356 (+),score=73.24 TRINITY_DN211_c0_g1_i1:247-1314(+)